MQSGFKTLSEMASEVERIETSKQDFLVPSRDMRLWDKDRLEIPDVGTYRLNDLAAGQMAVKLGIPKPFYNRMGDFAGLREHAVNELLKDSSGRRMVRTLDGTARAFLSDAYKPLDNFPILHGTLSAIENSNHSADVRFRSRNITDEKMYLQISFPSMTKEVVKGDPVEYGLVLTNSETGCGSVEVRSMIWRLVCSNGVIAGSVLKKRHVGKRVGEIESYDIFKDDTIQADATAFRLKFRDILEASMSEAAFENQISLLQNAAGDKIEKPAQTVENVTKHFNLSKDCGESILGNIVQEGNLSRYGLVNGITNLAHSVESADRQYEIEKLGHDVLTLTPPQWEKLSA